MAQLFGFQITRASKGQGEQPRFILPEPADGATRLYWLDYLGCVVAGQDEPAGLCVLLHDSPECPLGIWGKGISLVQEDDLERGTWNRGRPSELLDLGPD